MSANLSPFRSVALNAYEQVPKHRFFSLFYDDNWRRLVAFLWENHNVHWKSCLTPWRK